MSKWYTCLTMRKTQFVVGEYYHIYNRGVDKRNIFQDEKDLSRFWESMLDFNQIEPIGSIYEFSFIKREGKLLKKKPLVEFVAYCLNPNHYHFLLSPLEDQGIEKFMQRLGNGYTKYFNNRHKRSGVLFQGKFKSKHIDSNEYLLHLSVYVNYNNDKKLLGSLASKLSMSSIDEYLGNTKVKAFCKKDIVLEQFKTIKGYEKFALESLKDIFERKAQDFDFE